MLQLPYLTLYSISFQLVSLKKLTHRTRASDSTYLKALSSVTLKPTPRTPPSDVLHARFVSSCCALVYDGWKHQAISSRLFLVSLCLSFHRDSAPSQHRQPRSLPEGALVYLENTPRPRGQLGLGQTRLPVRHIPLNLSFPPGDRFSPTLLIQIDPSSSETILYLERRSPYSTLLAKRSYCLIHLMAGPGGGPPRKSHTKSRKGCKTCKRRHIRCDENFPQWYVDHWSIAV